MFAPGSSFALGANLPWDRYGSDFGANPWRPDGGIAAGTTPRLRPALADLADTGATIVRWFLFCDGRAGIVFDDDGRPVGLDAYVFADMDAALALLRAAGLCVVFSLVDFVWCARARTVNGVRTGGRRRALARQAWRAALVDRVLAPVLERYGRHPDIAAWEIINEPEWATRGRETWNPFSSVGRGAMRAFIADTVSAAHTCASQPVTVGSAHAGGLGLARGLDLDFYQVHWYDRLDGRGSLATPVSALGLDRPVVLGELPTRGSRYDPATLISLAKQAGYAGAWMWSLCADDASTDGAAALAALRATT